MAASREGLEDHDIILAKRIGRAEMLKRVGIFITVILSGACLVLVVVLVGQNANTTDQIRDTQKEGSPAVKQIIKQGKDQKELLEIIRSCTTPTGDCYKSNQARTGDAIDSITEATVYAVTCGINLVRVDQEASVKEVQECVKRLFNEQHPKEGE